MKRAIVPALLVAALLVGGFGCGKSQAPASGSAAVDYSNGGKPAYPGTAPYVPPKTPPPKSDVPGGPH